MCAKGGKDGGGRRHDGRVKMDQQRVEDGRERRRTYGKILERDPESHGIGRALDEIAYHGKDLLLLGADQNRRHCFMLQRIRVPVYG